MRSLDDEIFVELIVNDEIKIGYINDINENILTIRTSDIITEKIDKISFRGAFMTEDNGLKYQKFSNIKVNFIEKMSDNFLRYQVLMGENQISILNKHFHGNIVLSSMEKKDKELFLSFVNPKMREIAKKYDFTEIWEGFKIKNEELKVVFKNFCIEGIYYGSEFCPRLLPSEEELKYMLEKCKKENIKLVYVSPILYEEDIKKQEKLIDVIDDWGKKNNESIEMVVNNWGMFQYASNKKNIEITIGRNLIKVKRDPRFNYEKETIFEYKNELTKGELEIDSYRKFLKKIGVSGVELDYYPQGIDKIMNGEEFIYSIHMPYFIVAFSRMCLLGFLNRESKTMFDFKEKCNKECLNYHYEVNWWDSLPESLNGCQNSKISLKGRGLFSYDEKWKQHIENVIKSDISRIIFNIDVPY